MKRKKEENLPLVSVLIPCYNHEKYILECLNSIYNSKYANLELIIIDDGSKDTSYEITKVWIEENSERFKRTYIHKQSNLGICKTFNLLISLSQGDYIFPLASDDKVTKHGIYETYVALNKSKKDIIIADVKLIDENGLLVSKSAFNYFSKPINQYHWNWLFYTDIILNWNPPFQYYMIKKDYYVKHGAYDESLSFEDRDFVLNAILNKQITYCTCISREYRIRLSDRLTPGLSHSNILTELQVIMKKYQYKFDGYLRFLLMILSTEDKNDLKLVSLINKLLKRSMLKSIKFIVRIIFYLGSKNAKTNNK